MDLAPDRDTPFSIDSSDAPRLPSLASDTPLARRTFLKGASAFGLGSMVAGPLGALPMLEKGGSVGFGASCVLTPEVNPGPNWRPLAIERHNVREGLPGVPLSVFFKLVRLSDCQPVPGIVLDFWQADHQGVYSAVAAQGTVGLTFLRGYQTTPASGIVRFDTIYPGWYPGRTTHLHVKGLQGINTIFDTQLYLPEDVTRAVYETPVYKPFGQKDTKNVEDAFYLPETVLPVHTLRNRTFRATSSAFPTRLYAGMTLVLDI